MKEEQKIKDAMLELLEENQTLREELAATKTENKRIWHQNEELRTELGQANDERADHKMDAINWRLRCASMIPFVQKETLHEDMMKIHDDLMQKFCKDVKQHRD